MCRRIEDDPLTGESQTGLLSSPQIPFEALELTTDDGATLHVRCYGSVKAPTVVLVHGFACTHEYWTPQINALADKYRVVVYDQRISGRSKPGTRVLSPEVMGDDLSLVLRNVVEAGRPAVVVGHSFGGITVMAWAKQHPDEVNQFAGSIMLADTVAKGFAKQTAIIPKPGKHRVLRAPLLNVLLTAPIPIPPIGLYRQYFQQIVASRHSSAEAVDFVVATVASCPLATRMEWGRALRGVDVIDGIHNLTVPTTVLVGEDDALTPVTSSERIASLLREDGNLFRHVTIDRTGHCTNIEAPELFNIEIDRLVALICPDAAAS